MLKRNGFRLGFWMALSGAISVTLLSQTEIRSQNQGSTTYPSYSICGSSTTPSNTG